MYSTVFIMPTLHVFWVNLYLCVFFTFIKNTHYTYVAMLLFDWEFFWHNYCTIWNKIIMTFECLVSNPFRKQMFHQDCIDFRSLIIIYVIEIFCKLMIWCFFILNFRSILSKLEKSLLSIIVCVARVTYVHSFSTVYAL